MPAGDVRSFDDGEDATPLPSVTSPFDPPPTLHGPRTTLRPMLPTDLEATFKAAADPQIWSQHPAHDRHRREVFEAYFGMLVHAGGSMVVIDDASGAVIGCTRYYPVPGHSEDVAIGFTFLARAYWGGGWNAEMKGLMLTYAFQHVARVWFHVAPGNRRSQIAVERLGATLVAVEEVDVGTGSALTHCYAMTRPLTMTTP